MTTSINESIRVISLFEEGKIKPLLFSWRKRNYKILKTVFSYSKNIGQDKVFYFSVDTGGGVFELEFNREKMGWKINKIL
ncbi:MAG: hypothetical protein M1514_04035 [Patescibacteria group bacterium]|nr:hypothetical protein [Patescibacteria group bacterium]